MTTVDAGMDPTAGVRARDRACAALRARDRACAALRGRWRALRTAPAPPDGPPEPTVALQVNALQALCRQVFGFRLAMIAVAAPAALLHADPGLGAPLVGAAVVAAVTVSFVLFRDWERFGPLLLRHPALLAADTALGTLLLVSAGPDSTLAYVSVCTPLLAGLVYGWRSAAVFASLQGLILWLVQATLDRDRPTTLAESLLLPGLCVIVGAVGSALRHLMFRFGAATQALTEVRARLAATEAVAEERARLARELHDSVAKTLHGVALAAESLAATAARPAADPALIRHQADLVARSARRAAAESRALLRDLRTHPSPADPGVDVLPELRAVLADFTARTGLTAPYVGADRVPRTTGDRARQLLAVAAEALENAHRHADAARVEVGLAVRGDQLRLTVRDDGRGLPPDTTLEQLRGSGHFGLVGMVERAAAIGARIRIGRGERPRGTEVRLDIPLRVWRSST
ncbi:ATP-binding protein [Streptomyces sp. NPDC048290]|uniref:sensor histidine kinase n=1 Tax=Streptomyces sp. NPDC048290 TaxID=3155811 RepID=UPI00343A31CD